MQGNLNIRNKQKSKDQQFVLDVFIFTNVSQL